MTPAALHEIARQARVEILRSVAHAKAGHLGGPLSAVDILVSLYFEILRVRPEEPRWPDRDRFVLSKGHSSIALYAVMALRGFFPITELQTYDAIDSRLQGHPDMTKLPGLDMSTGSLGVGLSTAVGMGIGAKRQGRTLRVFAMLGDGECQEGQIWEAANVACRYELDNLFAIVDVNRLQQYGWVDAVTGDRQVPWPGSALGDAWRAFGWRVVRTDGHDLDALGTVLAETTSVAAGTGVPTVILADTIKGRGVSFMEGRFEWHARVPTDAELALALNELGA